MPGNALERVFLTKLALQRCNCVLFFVLVSSVPQQPAIVSACFFLHLILSRLSFRTICRTLLDRMNLTGESQAIDRVMCGFGHEYHRQNPTALEGGDDNFVLAMAIVMLNTNLHHSV
jgi:hypothetical protein